MNRRYVGGLLAVVILLSVSIAVAADSRRLAIVVRTDRYDLQEIGRILGADGLEGGEQAPFENGAGATVLVTEPIVDGERLVDVIAQLEGPGGPESVLAAGELLLSADDRRLIYSGLVMVELGAGHSEAALHSWERRHGVTVESSDMRERNLIYRIPLEASALLDLVNDLPASAGRATPIHHDIRMPRKLRKEDIGGYHVVPPLRNLLAVIYDPASLRSVFEDALRAGTTVEKVRGVEFFEFDDEDTMMEALRDLLTKDSITAGGPAVSISPPRFLSDRLVVRFSTPPDRRRATYLLALHNLREIRELPYLENGFLFQGPEPSYDLYTAGEELLASGWAKLAVPDVISENRSLCEAADCTPNPHQTYLKKIHAPAAWSSAAANDRETVIGVLDEGFDASDDLQCDELEVAGMLNAPNEDHPSCIPEDMSDWCVNRSAGGCKEMDIADKSHGFAMAAAAAAAAAKTQTLDDGTSPCDNLVGLAPAAPVLDVERPDYSKDSVLASALWWMAGGKEQGYADALVGSWQDRRATVINLSFLRDFRSEKRCPEINPAACAAVCDAGETCSLLDKVLERLAAFDEDNVQRRSDYGLRPEGILVVAAMGASAGSDFASSDHTVAAGTVTTLGKPFGDSGEFHEPGDYLDVVVPVGASEEINLSDSGIKAGGSSTAAAVTSGVAALMFDVNPGLTTAQAQCILHVTGQRHYADGDMWHHSILDSWHANNETTENCRFGSIVKRSRCFGFGMIDAHAAVRAARNCRICTVPVMAPDGSGAVGVSRAPCQLLPWVEDDPEFPCPCNENGTPMSNLVRIPPQSFCLTCAESQTQVGPYIEKILKLLQCLHDGLCLCEPEDQACISLEAVNKSDSDFNEVTAEFCIESRCRKLPGEWAEWPRGETLTIPLSKELEIPKVWWGPQFPELRFLSGGKPIDIRRPDAQTVISFGSVHKLDRP